MAKTSFAAKHTTESQNNQQEIGLTIMCVDDRMPQAKSLFDSNFQVFVERNPSGTIPDFTQSSNSSMNATIGMLANKAKNEGKNLTVLIMGHFDCKALQASSQESTKRVLGGWAKNLESQNPNKQQGLQLMELQEEKRTNLLEHPEIKKLPEGSLNIVMALYDPDQKRAYKQDPKSGVYIIQPTNAKLVGNQPLLCATL